METFGAVPEPEWILDRTRSGSLYWRRETTENNSRVKFRYDVEVKEFHRGPHELESFEWPVCIRVGHESNPITRGLTCIICIAVTFWLPWYIMARTNNN